MRIFIIIIFIAVAVAVFLIWTQPLWQESSALRAEKSAIESTVSRLFSLRQIRDDLLSEYNIISRDDLLRLNKFLPSSPNRGQMLIEFENIARNHNVILRKVDISSENDNSAAARNIPGGLRAPSNNPYEEIPFNLIVSGSYESFLLFLTDLEKSLRLFDVDNISFFSSDKTTYDFTVKAHAYWLKN